MRSLRVLVICATLLALPSLALAATIDGRVTAGEYATSASGTGIVLDVEYTLEGGGGPESTKAKLYLFQNSTTDDLDIAIVFPRELNDTTYGDKANPINTPPGYRHGSWTAAGVGHNWQDLNESDEGTFIIKDKDGNVILDFLMDYYESSDDGSPDVDDDLLSTFNAGSDADISLARSSMTYNELNFFGLTVGTDGIDGSTLFGNNTNSPELTQPDNGDLTSDMWVYDPVLNALDGWVMDITYEFRVLGSSLSDFDFSKVADSIMLGDFHHSPNKQGKGRITTTTITIPPGGVVIPLPGSVWMGLGMLGLLGVVRRRRRRRVED